MAIALKVDNLSKAYRLGEIGTGTISRDIERWYARIRGREDPFLKIGEINDRTRKSDNNIIWSLRDINFEVEQGEAVGIIGANGAGKSTLLKILSRITSPTTGKIQGNGRISSILEVGTGFNPELTGRENVFLNGAILGMRKAEIKKHFDAIVDFAGVERYIDTPVKRYSSGMYLRLAFAVAAYLESEILIVDEVLAVGDAEFQKKCLGKMGDVSKGDGRTVLFVSHNLQAVQNLCVKGIVLDSGVQIFSGNINDAVNRYSTKDKNNLTRTHWQNGYFENNLVDIRSAKVTAADNDLITTDSQIEVEITAVIKKNDINILMELYLFNADGVMVFDVVSNHDNFKANAYTFKCIIPKNLMNAGNYSLDLLVIQNHTSVLYTIRNILNFEIGEGERLIDFHNIWPGIIRPRFNWVIKNERPKMKE